mgnify:CR=1 FL=1
MNIGKTLNKTVCNKIGDISDDIWIIIHKGISSNVDNITYTQIWNIINRHINIAYEYR